jgi:predicted nucleic acid-binding protein
VKRKGVLIDSGPRVALLSERDNFHSVCLEQARILRGPFNTSWPVITEAAHLLKNRASAVDKLLVWIRTSEIGILPLTADDVSGIAEILARYSDQGFDFADAASMHLADREDIQTVFTIDHRHFSVYRTKQRQHLSIVPAIL